MRKHITTLKQKITIRTSSMLISIALVLVAIPAAVLAYGPDRPTFTIHSPATYVTFNSITDDPTWGDERNFFRARDISTNETYKDDISLVPGKEYEAIISFHNNAASTLNESGVGLAHGAYARAEMPAVIKKGQSGVEGNAYVGATNANPTTVYDYVNFSNQTQGDIALRYIAGSATIYSKGAVNGKSLGDSALFSSNGTPVGYSALDGELPGCDQYSGYIKFRFTAAQPNFTFAKDVRLSGTKDWQDKITVNKGATVEYELSYENTGNTQQDDVVLTDILPAGVTYIPGSTKLYDVASPDGKKMEDKMANGGLNIGNYTKGSNAFLVFSARIDGEPCSVLTNTAGVQTDNGNLQDTATVTVAGDCAAALPTTGPAQVIAGLVGVGAITFGVVYYLKSRRELEDALLHTQAHPITLSTNHPTSAPDAAKADDVEADHKHKHSEHKK